jgi:hypothetical protein
MTPMTPAFMLRKYEDPASLLVNRFPNHTLALDIPSVSVNNNFPSSIVFATGKPPSTFPRLRKRATRLSRALSSTHSLILSTLPYIYSRPLLFFHDFGKIKDYIVVD